MTTATIKRDLVALSSVLNFSIDQGRRDDNPVLPRLGRIKRTAQPDHPAAAIPYRPERSSGMIADMIRVAIATGAREDELLRAERDSVDHDRRQMTIVGKRNKRRIIDLHPFGAYSLISALPAYATKPLLFWHSDGENYKNFASQFAAIVARTAAWASENGVEFRRFRFHDLRHWHAVQWL